MNLQTTASDRIDLAGRYHAAIHRFPMLSAEEERHLAMAWRANGDQKAFEKLVTSHLRLAAKAARGYLSYGLPLADLVSAGNIGLLEAVRRFDPDHGNRLATYAMWWIRAEIKQYIVAAWSVVRIARTPAQKKLFFNLRRLKAEISTGDGQSLSPDEASKIASLLHLRERDVRDMNGRLSGHDLSLNLPQGENAEEWQDALVSEEMSPEASLAERDELQVNRARLRDAIEVLSTREKAILFERRMSDKPPTLAALSAHYGVSRERVRQIENQAMEKLRRATALQQATASPAFAAE